VNKDTDILHKFIANNYDLENLEAKLNEFNPLKVLKVDQYEIRHSNILAWLLNPKENHNLGDSFFKKILSEVISNNENLETDLDVFWVQEFSYLDFEVYREWKNKDILLVSKKNNVVVLIENKINSTESSGQLSCYLKEIQEEFKGMDIVPVFLSLLGEEPTNKKYGILTYVQILKILNFITTIKKDNLSPKVYDFISYYLSILEVLTMENESLKELCKKIYKEHKTALDLIIEYAGYTEFEDYAKEFILNLGAKEISVSGKSAWFMPQNFESKIQMVGEKSWCGGYPIAFWFLAKEEKLGLILEVGPFENNSLRESFLAHLKKYSFKIGDKSFKPGAKYTRVYTTYPKFQDWDNRDSVIQKMDDLFYNTKTQDNIERLEKACDSFQWEIE
jgi:hypothetical protein